MQEFIFFHTNFFLQNLNSYLQSETPNPKLDRGGLELTLDMAHCREFFLTFIPRKLQNYLVETLCREGLVPCLLYPT